MELVRNANVVEAPVTEEAEVYGGIAVLGQNTVANILDSVKGIPIMRPEYTNFLMSHQKHLGTVMEKTFMWRTDTQKKSIINDFQHPTDHSKFHQSILEQKVQFDQALYLTKDFEIKKIDIDELMMDVEEAEMKVQKLTDEQAPQIEIRRAQNALDKKKIEVSFSQYEMAQMKISMEYRMAEVVGWQTIIDELMDNMHANGATDDVIWDKDAGESEALFLSYMIKYQDISEQSDPGSANNIKSLAKFAYQQMWQAGMIPALYVYRCDPIQRRTIIELAQLQGDYDRLREGVDSVLAEHVKRNPDDSGVVDALKLPDLRR